MGLSIGAILDVVGAATSKALAAVRPVGFEPSWNVDYEDDPDFTDTAGAHLPWWGWRAVRGERFARGLNALRGTQGETVLPNADHIPGCLHATASISTPRQFSAVQSPF